MEDQRAKWVQGRKEVTTTYGLNRQGEKVNSWAPGVTWKKLESCALVWQERKP